MRSFSGRGYSYFPPLTCGTSMNELFNVWIHGENNISHIYVKGGVKKP